MPGKIFTAYHFTPERFRFDSLHSPVIIGDAAKSLLPSRSPFLLDPDDDEISRENSYAENRVKWYVYKHQAQHYSWVGFEQYRRIIDFGQRTNAEIEFLAESHDIITCPPLSGVHNSTRAQYKACHPAEHWELFENALETLPLSIDKNISWEFSANLIPHGIGTMRTEEFKRYMSQWKLMFSALSKVIQPPVDHYQRRAYAFLSERFFSLYIYRLLAEKPNTKVLYLPHMEFSQVPA